MPVRFFLSHRYIPIMTFIHTLGSQQFNPSETGFLMVRHLANACGKELSTRYKKNLNLTETTLIALGGFGRREMCPLSDIDILILLPDGGALSETEEGIKTFLHSLYELNLTVGHTVMTIAQLREALQEQDVKQLTTLLDGRYLCGNKKLGHRFEIEIQQYLDTNKNLFPMYQLSSIYLETIENTGGSVHLLEPNIKRSPGALRDVHLLGWLFRFLPDQEPLFNFRSEDDETQTERVLIKLYKAGLITETQYRHVYEATDFMLKTRFALHLIDKQSSDLMGFTQQPKIAAYLGFRGETDKELSEPLMKRYYLQARKIHRLVRTQVQKVAEFCIPETNTPIIPLDAGFIIKDNRIRIQNSTTEAAIEKLISKSPFTIMQAFYFQAKYGILFSDELRSVLSQSIESIDEDFQNNPRIHYLFRQILSSTYCSFTLKNMLELGILNRFIPEYGPLVGLYQRNAYHWYTADYHTLVAIEKLEDSKTKWKNVYRIWQALPKKELLVMSIICHDIGKGFDIARHEIVGMDVAEQLMTRLGYDESDIQLVRFMVKYHLHMEQTAFRKNYHDPQTLQEFTDLFPDTEYLDVLYCLTYSDLSAVNPTVWTDWKGMMLDELFYLSRQRIEQSEITGHQILESERNQKIEQLISGDTDPAILEHIHELNSRFDYWMTFQPEDIRRHAEFRKNNLPLDLIVRFYDGFIEITVITNDKSGLLHKVCGAISSMDCSIFDARIFTTSDGVIIDRFRVFPFVQSEKTVEEFHQELNSKVELILFKEESVEILVDKFLKRWKRKYKQERLFTPEISFTLNGQLDTIEIYAPDAPGLLYKITQAFSGFDLSIHQAKIATRVDGVHDTFFVDGLKLLTESEQSELKETLIENILLVTQPVGK